MTTPRKPHRWHHRRKSKRVFEHAQNLTVMPAKPQPSPLESPHHQLTAVLGVSPCKRTGPCRVAPPLLDGGESSSLDCHRQRQHTCSAADLHAADWFRVWRPCFQACRFDESSAQIVPQSNERTSRPVSSRHATPVWAFQFLITPPPSLSGWSIVRSMPLLIPISLPLPSAACSRPAAQST